MIHLIKKKECHYLSPIYQCYRKVFSKAFFVLLNWRLLNMRIKNKILREKILVSWIICIPRLYIKELVFSIRKKFFESLTDTHKLKQLFHVIDLSFNDILRIILVQNSYLLDFIYSLHPRNFEPEKTVVARCCTNFDKKNRYH